MKNLQELADYMNSREYNQLVVNEAIEKNGWIDLTNDDFDVAADGKEKVTLDQNTGAAKVVDYVDKKAQHNYLAINAWVFFTFNYFDPKEIIDYICEKTHGHYDRKHLYDKFSEIYDRVGSRAAMSVFYCELGNSLRRALVDYAIHEYAPQGLLLTDEDKDFLGID